MIHGLDTSFLVAVEIAGHPTHGRARALLDRTLDAGDRLGLAPQVLAELIHVVTDGRRFEKPLSIEKARERAEQWWTAKEVVPVLPSEHAAALFFAWLRDHELGRKRLLDTLLAATYLSGEVDSILTTNARDFRVFGRFSVLEP